ncbi:hypothetical protein [Salinicoccus bachuensis]|uniref:Uncharacterized protein n=1 Tax=Salinicoccus bachuensis TaxID=3136731 RepID=A0ABZ3CI43_9STAP
MAGIISATPYLQMQTWHRERLGRKNLALESHHLFDAESCRGSVSHDKAVGRLC